MISLPFTNISLCYYNFVCLFNLSKTIIVHNQYFESHGIHIFKCGDTQLCKRKNKRVSACFFWKDF